MKELISRMKYLMDQRQDTVNQISNLFGWLYTEHTLLTIILVAIIATFILVFMYLLIKTFRYKYLHKNFKKELLMDLARFRRGDL